MSEELEQEETEEQSEEVQEETVAEETTEEIAEEAFEEPANELSRPAVIDLAALLKPISGENPSGEYMRYSGIYDEISEARREDEDLDQGDWQVELKVADHKKVIELADATLRTETKDLQIAAWFAEALVMEHGFAGLRDSLKLLSGLQKNFWETIFPEIDEGDEEGRANALAWMDKETAFAIKKAPISQGEGYGFLDYEDSKRFDIPDNIDSLGSEDQQKYRDLEAQAEKGNRTTRSKWEKAVASSKRAFYEELDVAIEECLAAYAELNKAAEEHFDPNQVPSLNTLKKSLDEIQSQTNKLLEQKRKEEPEATDFEDHSSNDEETTNGSTNSGDGFSVSGAINSRREALRRLSEIANFFSQTEPHSPVAHLINRAVKWGEMPLDGWLKEVVKDETVLEQIRETLGFNTSSYEENSYEESEGESSSDDW